MNIPTMMRKFVLMRSILVASLGALLATSAQAHVTYVPIFIPGGAVNTAPFAVGDASKGKGAGTPEYDAFMHCDGFGRPDGKSDEMNQIMHSVLFDNGVHPQLRYPVLPVPGSAGIDACTRALADSALDASFVARRAHLLMFRALRRAAALDAAGATADLDAARALLGDAAADPALARSLGVDFTLVAAFAAAQIKDGEKAKALFQTAVDARPDDVRLLGLAPIFLDARAVLNTSQPMSRLMAAENPAWRGVLHLKAALDGDFQTLVDLYPLLNDSFLPVRFLPGLHAIDGRTAYALAALGHGEQAQALLGSVRDYITAHTPPEPAPLAAGATEGRREASARAEATSARKAMQATAAQVDTWAEAIVLRQRVIAATPEELPAVMAAIKPDLPIDVRADLYRLARPRTTLTPAQTGVLTTVSDHSAEVILANGQPAPAVRIARALLYPERYTLVPQGFTKGADYAGFKWANPGQRWHANAGQGIVTYTYGNEVNMPEVIDEEELIDIALDARKMGKTGIVIRSRKTTHHLVNTSLHNGYDTVMNVDFVDIAKLPDIYRPVPWAVIPVEAILARLMPFYAHPAPAGS
jgi:hypothetical protein